MKEMKKLLEANAAYGRRRASQVFRDFCELAAISMRNAVDRHSGYADREARYAEVARGYTAEELTRFSRLLGLVTDELGNGLSDVLGRLYMGLDLGNEALGQFFTPYEVSLVMARMTVGSVTEKLATQDFVTVHEPAGGSGGMMIAMAAALQEQGINYQQRMHVTATDLDITAVHMSYIQLSLAFVPAVVVHGNTLTLEQHDAWPTPAHVLGGWRSRLADRIATDSLRPA